MKSHLRSRHLRRGAHVCRERVVRATTLVDCSVESMGNENVNVSYIEATVMTRKWGSRGEKKKIKKKIWT